MLQLQRDLDELSLKVKWELANGTWHGWQNGKFATKKAGRLANYQGPFSQKRPFAKVGDRPSDEGHSCGLQIAFRILPYWVSLKRFLPRLGKPGFCGSSLQPLNENQKNQKKKQRM